MKLLRRDDLHSLTGAYVLDALDGLEGERFERHLAGCPACQHEVRGLQETATRFAVAVSQPPPPRLKTRVMAEAGRTGQLPPVPDVRIRPEAGTGWPRRLALPLATASLVLAIVLGVLLGITRSQLADVQAQQRAIAAVLSSPGARIVTDKTSLGGSATVVVARSLHRLVFTSTGMPGLPGSKVYQLWLIGPGGAASSAGLLTRSADGNTVPVLASGLATGDSVGVTVEPAGGTARPTTTPIVVISLPS